RRGEEPGVHARPDRRADRGLGDAEAVEDAGLALRGGAAVVAHHRKDERQRALRLQHRHHRADDLGDAIDAAAAGADGDAFAEGGARLVGEQRRQLCGERACRIGEAVRGDVRLDDELARERGIGREADRHQASISSANRLDYTRSCHRPARVPVIGSEVAMTRLNSFGARTTLQTPNGAVEYVSLPALEKAGFPQVAKLPYSLRILLENLLRMEDGAYVKKDDIAALASWNPAKHTEREIAFSPARVLLQDFTGVPA